MKKSVLFWLAFALIFSLSVCNKSNDSKKSESVSRPSSSQTTAVFQATSENEPDLKMEITAGEKAFSVTLENCEASKQLFEMLPFTITMNDYQGFEKVGTLEKPLSASNKRITAKPGDIVLYNGNSIVIFYGSNTWEYTLLGHVDDLRGLDEALKGEKINVAFSLD